MTKKQLYFQKNKEILRDKKRAYRQKNRELHLAQDQKYRDNNKEKIANYHKEYRKANKDVITLREKLYKEAHKEHYREYFKTYTSVRKRNDPLFKLINCLRRRLLRAIKDAGCKKTQKSIDLIGCSSEFAYKYIESLFKEGMSWENHGSKGWHIDHIIPCAAFDLSKPEQQKKCFHYTNLQPLWWWENLSKGDKF